MSRPVNVTHLVKDPGIRENYIVTVTASVDLAPVRGNAMASGDDEVDKACEDEIIRRLMDGDVWGWASVCVKVERKCPHCGTGTGETQYDRLGCCTYKSTEDFVKSSGYFDDMVNSCVETMNTGEGVVTNA